jgi:tyrosyl-tRNA synthetase
MSSSKKNTMFPLHADPEEIRDVIEDAYCPQGEVEDNPIIQICKLFIFGADRDLEVSRKEEHGGNLHYEKFEEMADDFESGELHPLDLKEAVAEEVVERFKPVRDKFRENPDLLEPLEEIGHETPEYIT